MSDEAYIIIFFNFPLQKQFAKPHLTLPNDKLKIVSYENNIQEYVREFKNHDWHGIDQGYILNLVKSRYKLLVA